MAVFRLLICFCAAGCASAEHGSTVAATAGGRVVGVEAPFSSARFLEGRSGRGPQISRRFTHTLRVPRNDLLWLLIISPPLFASGRALLSVGVRIDGNWVLMSRRKLRLRDGRAGFRAELALVPLGRRRLLTSPRRRRDLPFFQLRGPVPSIAGGNAWSPADRRRRGSHSTPKLSLRIDGAQYRLVGWLYPVSPAISRHWLRCCHGLRAPIQLERPSRLIAMDEGAYVRFLCSRSGGDVASNFRPLLPRKPAAAPGQLFASREDVIQHRN